MTPAELAEHVRTEHTVRPHAELTTHVYISTACWHEFHDECRITCKFCDSWCRCPHHGKQ